MSKKDIRYYWDLKGFTPNPKQEQAILHTEGPLFLTAGPGSGKTRVILWRTVNLIVFHQVDPKKIFLATFTEKAQGLAITADHDEPRFPISVCSKHRICPYRTAEIFKISTRMVTPRYACL